MRTRWVAILLCASVALNLFFLGLLSARAFQRGEGRDPRQGHAMAGDGPHRPRQRPRPFEWMTDEEREQLRPARRELRSTRGEVQQSLGAEPFDREKLSQALGKLRRQTDGIQASVHEFMLQRAEGMTADDRRRLADTQWQSDSH